MGRRIILGLPGLWKSHRDILVSIAKRSDGLLYAGSLLFDSRTKVGYEAEVYAADPGLAKAFELAAQGKIDPKELAQIANQTFTLYVLSKDVSVAAARTMMDLGCRLLNSGGLAVKVESSGLAHSAARWRELTASENPFDLYCAFVTLIGGQDVYYSCGMHNFGLRDASVEKSLSLAEAAEALNAFNHWHLSRNIALRDGEEIAVLKNSAKFRIRERLCESYPPDHSFHNPFGMWHLERLGATDLVPKSAPLESSKRSRDGAASSPFAEPTGEPLFMAIHQGNPEILRAVAQARRSLDRFREYLQSKKGPEVSHGIKLRFRDPDLSQKLGEDRYLFLWLRSVESDGTRFTAKIFEIPREVNWLKRGQVVTAGDDEIYDWIVIEDGHAFGGFSLRVMQKHLPPSQVADWMRFIGVTRFEPIDDRQRGLFDDFASKAAVTTPPPAPHPPPAPSHTPDPPRRHPPAQYPPT